MPPGPRLPGVAALALLGLLGGAQAQERGSVGETDCGAKAALYEGPSGFKLWVVRRGAMEQSNALRPLSGSTSLRVLEVSIAGRSATAYGPDFASLVRGGPPEQLEKGLDTAIVWEGAVGTLPRTLRIVAEDGSPMAELSFAQCGTAPARARAAPAKVPRAEASPRSERGLRPAPGAPLPQGAIQGLDLQR